ncbi:hypothetical protein [Nesterenkonia sp. NBAIMH1]|uniref:hypothetical protein n=1 Tax=Nesterenkonia sp. NBAIMH1 TaxID=2600320 RepID=UPI0011B82267|nr:hypothetical protein [Nesterenkonia sp. NBAIMH1]
MEGFEDFTDERAADPLTRLKQLNQLEGVRRSEDAEQAKKDEAQAKRQLTFPRRIWRSAAEVDPAQPSQYLALAADEQHDFLFLPKAGAQKLFVFFSGYADRSKVQPPVFQRWTWAEKFPGHCVYFSDPALMGSGNLTTSYYTGSRQTDSLKVIAQFVRDLAERLGILPENIVTYGSSAGGMASLRIAQHLRGAAHIAINPQTHLAAHRQEKVNRVARERFGEDSLSPAAR